MLILTIQHLTTIWFHDTTNKKTTPHKQKTTLLGNNTAKYTPTTNIYNNTNSALSSISRAPNAPAWSYTLAAGSLPLPAKGNPNPTGVVARAAPSWATWGQSLTKMSALGPPVVL